MYTVNYYIYVIVAVVSLIDYIEIKAHHWMGFFAFGATVLQLIIARQLN